MRLEPARRPASPQPGDWIPDRGVGQRVEILWDSPRGWYGGTVVSEATAQSGPGLLNRKIRYDDGEEADEVLGGRRTRPISRATASGGAAATSTDLSVAGPATAAASAAAAPPPPPGTETHPSEPALDRASAAAGSYRPILLPLGVTENQRDKIRQNLAGERDGPPGGVMGRFGLSGMPENTWHCYTGDFTVRNDSISVY